MRIPNFLAFAMLSTSASAQMISMPPSAVVDEPVALAVSGLKPGEKVTLEIMRVTGSGQASASTNLFAVRPDGTLNPVTDAPEVGYPAADPAGPFWSMRPLREQRPESERGTMSVRVKSGDTVLASRTIPLTDMGPDVGAEDVAEFPGARLYRVRSEKRLPVLILLGGSEGGAWIGRSLAPRLAAAGFAVLALPYYSPGWGEPRIQGLPSSFSDIPVDRLERVREWIVTRADLNANAVGLYGVSKGGEFAMIAASHYRWLRAVIGVVPSDVVWEGWGTRDPEGSRSSFSWHGRSLPFTPYEGMSKALAEIGKGKRVDLVGPHREGRRSNPARAAMARIPVERYHGAMLLAGGDKDRTWPSGEMVRAIAERRAERGLPTTVMSFPDAGHGLAGTGWAPLYYPGMEAEAASNARAQQTLWSETISFLRRNLEPAKGAG